MTFSLLFKIFKFNSKLINYSMLLFSKAKLGSPLAHMKKHIKLNIVLNSLFHCLKYFLISLLYKILDINASYGDSKDLNLCFRCISNLNQ